MKGLYAEKPTAARHGKCSGIDETLPAHQKKE
jgi:hypothetical protein